MHPISYLDTSQERIEIDLVHCPVVQVGAKTIPPVFLVVSEKMLCACLDADTLHARDCFIGTFAVEVGIRAKAEDSRGLGMKIVSKVLVNYLSHPRPAFGFLIFDYPRSTTLI